MGNIYLLATPDSLVDCIESVLASHEIQFVRNHDAAEKIGRHTVDLVEFTCRADRGTVELGIEKRRGRNGAYIILAPSLRLFFWRNHYSIALAERMAKFLCEQGADDSPETRCEDMG